jgi:hypothetical protein
MSRPPDLWRILAILVGGVALVIFVTTFGHLGLFF